MKRSNVNAHQSKEEYESFGGGDETAGIFKKAPASVMAERKIFTAGKRK